MKGEGGGGGGGGRRRIPLRACKKMFYFHTNRKNPEGKKILKKLRLL